MPAAHQSIDELRKILLSELGKESPDSGLILSLSQQIASLDETQIRFSIDAGIINRLGKELVGRVETAVSELVKNAYDADATEVKLVFERADRPGGVLYIDDNGVGMTRDQLINGFMRLSSTSKIHNPVSDRYGRFRAGRKGIGRFATQRLGRRLKIITQTEDSDLAYQLIFDWDQFENDLDLQLIPNAMSEVEKTKEEGTTLIIENLRDVWSEPQMKRVYRRTAELIQPYPLAKRNKKKGGKESDPGFKSYYFVSDGNTNVPVIDDTKWMVDSALAEVDGAISRDGSGSWTIKSNKLDIPKTTRAIGADRNDPYKKFDKLADIRFKIYYFLLDSKNVSKQQLGYLKQLVNDVGGIRLYRNGFRVLPYGEPGNDWLRLDESVRRRVILTPHSNINFIGFVEVFDEFGEHFEETSSREGLGQNDSFEQLTDFVYRSIISAIGEIARARETKHTAGQKDWKKTIETVDFAISELKEAVDRANSDPKRQSIETFAEMNQKLVALETARATEKMDSARQIEEFNMLRVLAGLGLVIGEFVHEIQNFLPGFDADIVYLKKAVATIKEASNRVDQLSQNFRGFSVYTSYFYDAISRNVIREIEPIEVRDVIYDFEKVIAEDAGRSKIKFHKPIFEDYDLWTVPMHRSEWASILFNFYTNSKKAIRRARVKGEIFIRAGRASDQIFLEFSDNGDGIPAENREKIFDPFFTTTSAAGNSESDENALTGLGLGLKIVRDIVESYGGEVGVVPANEGFQTTLRISVPEKNMDGAHDD